MLSPHATESTPEVDKSDWGPVSHAIGRKYTGLPAPAADAVPFEPVRPAFDPTKYQPPFVIDPFTKTRRPNPQAPEAIRGPMEPTLIPFAPQHRLVESIKKDAAFRRELIQALNTNGDLVRAIVTEMRGDGHNV